MAPTRQLSVFIAAVFLVVKTECACNVNCAPCDASGPGTCDSYCEHGYGNRPNGTGQICERCDLNCAAVRLELISNYVKLSGGCAVHGAGKCDGPCVPGNGLTSDHSCAQCPDNCASCGRGAAGTCDICDDGFGLTPSGTCDRCDPHCASSRCGNSGARKCDESCIPGYRLTSENMCARCPDNCWSCGNTTFRKCDACFAGFGLTANETCEHLGCPDFCYSCRRYGAGKCDLCDNGFGLTPNRTCQRCAENCQSCSRVGGGKCDDCHHKFGLTPDLTCAKCDPNCPSGRCNIHGAGKCDKACASGYVLTSDRSCAPCDPNCASGGCNKHGAEKCDESCVSGYVLTSNHSCAACDPNCASGGCDKHGAGKCDGTCVSSYGLTSSHTCAALSRTTDTTMTSSSLSPEFMALIVVLSVVFAILLIISFIAVVSMKRKLKETRGLPRVSVAVGHEYTVVLDSQPGPRPAIGSESASSQDEVCPCCRWH